jgi:hypothetical protein
MVEQLVFPNGAQCPVCRKGRLNETKRILKREYVCTNQACQAAFTSYEGTMTLIRCSGYPGFCQRYPYPLLFREWINISNGGLSDLEANALEASLQSQKVAEKRQREIDAINNGNIDSIARTSPIGVLLKNGEECFGQISKVEFFEDRAVRQWVGGSTGMSFRVAKGVYMRVGQHQGHAESHDEKRLIDTGILTITSKRLIFRGSGRINEIPLSKIISLEGYRDGIVIAKSGKQKAEYYRGFDGVIISSLVAELNRRLNDS